MVEHLPEEQRVPSSSLGPSTTRIKAPLRQEVLLFLLRCREEHDLRHVRQARIGVAELLRGVERRGSFVTEPGSQHHNSKTPLYLRSVLLFLDTLHFQLCLSSLINLRKPDNEKAMLFYCFRLFYFHFMRKENSSCERPPIELFIEIIIMIKLARFFAVFSTSKYF